MMGDHRIVRAIRDAGDEGPNSPAGRDRGDARRDAALARGDRFNQRLQQDAKPTGWRHWLPRVAFDGFIGILLLEGWLLMAVAQATREDSAAGIGIFAAPLLLIPGLIGGIVVGAVVRAVVSAVRGRS